MRPYYNNYVGIVVALPEEAAIFRGLLADWNVGTLGGSPCALGYFTSQPVVVITSGQGAERARYAAQSLLDHFSPRCLISSGYCGGLQLRVRVGDIAIPTALAPLSERCREQMAPEESLLGWAREAGKQWAAQQKERCLPADRVSNCWEGLSLMSDCVVGNSAEKFALGNDSEAMFVEMESWAVAETASQHETPFLCVRVVSDAVHDDVPMNFSECCDGRGQISYSAVARRTLFKPTVVPKLISLASKSQHAQRCLAQYMSLLLPHLVHEVL